MIKYLSKKIEQWCTVGLKLPYAHDPTTDKPSITLLFPYVTFLMLVISTIALHFNIKLVIASIFVAMIWVASVIFYLIRKVHKAKVDLDDKFFELEGGEE